MPTRVLTSLGGLSLPLDEGGRLATLCAADRCDEMSTQLLERVRERRVAVTAARAELDHLERELANLEAVLASGQPKTNLCLGEEVSE